MGYDGKVKVNTVILHKLFYESEHEYIERINSIGHLPVGVAYLLSEKYDMDNERLPIEMQIYKWCNKNLNESQGDIYVGRVDGKRLCSNNLYYTLVGKFKIDNSIIKITNLQIYDKLADNKINVQLKSDREEQIKINYELGNKYYAGEGVKVDYKKAFSYYYMSAKEGHPESQAMIGDIYFYAKGVEEDYEEAFRWYKLAAEKGDTTAQGNLSVMYCWGMGVKQDDEEGVKWGKLAAQGGDATAQANLACMYYEGKVIEKDYNEAMKWFKLSAKQENLSAKHMIGQMYYLGKGINKDYKEAFKWYISAAEQGFEASQCMVGQMYHRGEGIAMDYSEAIKWYRLAERNGYTLAKERLKELGINK